MRYLWAAYKMGTDFDELDEDLEVAEFKEAFATMVLEEFDACWTLFAPVKGEKKPVGVIFGYWPHPRAYNMILHAMVWFPWATARNRVESAVNFLVKIRHEIPMVGFARPKDGPFFITLMRHGMVRRVGTSHTTFPDSVAQVYETRTEANGQQVKTESQD